MQGDGLRRRCALKASAGVGGLRGRAAAAQPRHNVRFGSLADIRERSRDVRFTLRSGHAHRRHQCLLCAINGRGGKVTIFYEVVPEPKIGIDQA